jgi:hypothetical protein
MAVAFTHALHEVQLYKFKSNTDTIWGHMVAQWLRHCATNRTVAGLIPDGVIGIFC